MDVDIDSGFSTSLNEIALDIQSINPLAFGEVECILLGEQYRQCTSLLLDKHISHISMIYLLAVLSIILLESAYMCTYHHSHYK